MIPIADCKNCSGCKKECYDILNVCFQPAVQNDRARNSAVHKADIKRFWNYRGVIMGPMKYNMLSILEERTNEYSDRIALGIRTQMGWKEFSYKGLGLLSRQLGNPLINAVQVKKGERCAILSESKPV